MSYKCELHKKYEALKKPRAKCWVCWMMFLESNPDTPVIASDLLNMALSFDQTTKDITVKALDEAGLSVDDRDFIDTILKEEGMIKVK